jgi:subtilisin family serine protease
MKTRALVPLNIRTGVPEVLPNNNTGDKFFNEGEVLDIAEAVMGENYKSNNLWYKLDNGGFVWSEGVENPSSPDFINKLAGNPFKNIINYNENAFLELPGNLKNTKGRGVKIAVLDTGLNKSHPSFNNDASIFLVENVTSSNAGTDDINGHGSHVAGLIGARSGTNTGIIGIAPESELYIIKCINDNSSTSATNLSKGLKLAIDAKVDIINLSLDITNERFNLIETDITKALQENIIIVAAAGSNDQLLNTTDLLCPANKPNIIAIGSLDDTSIINPSMLNQKINYVEPNYYLWSCHNKTKIFETEKGSSMATALITGVIALFISSNKVKNVDQILNFLNDSSLLFHQFTKNKISLLKPFK